MVNILTKIGLFWQDFSEVQSLWTLQSVLNET